MENTGGNMLESKIKAGDQVPEFEAMDQDGNPIKAEDLEGYPTILFFYPSFHTPDGEELCVLYNEYLGEFDDLEAVVIGVSSDSRAFHQEFMKEFELYFPLISDENLSLSRLFDVVTEDEETKTPQIEPTVFLIDWEKTVCWIERPFNFDGHLDRLVQALDEFCGG